MKTAHATTHVVKVVVLLLLSTSALIHSAELYSKDVLDWSVHYNLHQFKWNDSYVNSNYIRKGYLSPSLPIVFIQQHLVAFIWNQISQEFRISSLDDLISIIRNNNTSMGTNILKIGIDRHQVLLFSNLLKYHGIDMDVQTTHEGKSYSISPFLFYRRNCRPRHVFEDFDVIIALPGDFFDVIRYYRESTGKRKVSSEKLTESQWNETTLINPSDFLPIKLAPSNVGYEYDVYPFFMLGNSTFNPKNSYYVSDIITLNQYFEFGKVTTQDLEFINYLLLTYGNSPVNFTSDSLAFDKMMLKTLQFLNVSSFPQQFSLENVYSNYYSSQYHFCTESTCNDYISANQDYWNIPTLIIVTLYFIILFSSRFFLKDSFKRRLLVPYLPISIYFFELTHSYYFNKACLQVINYIRMFVITWIIASYVLTVVRFYMLRNLYSLLNNPLLVNKKIGQISIVKRLVSPLNSILLIILLSAISSVVFSLHGMAMFFDIFMFEEEVFSVTNISFVIYILVGCSLGIATVIVDCIVNWKKIKTKGLVSFLKYDDPFKVRVDLLSMILLLIVAIIHVCDPSNLRVYFFFESVLFIFMCGGFALIFETFHTILRKRNHQTLSELENFLKDDNFKLIFKEFSSKEFSLENIFFFEKITQLKKQFGNSTLEISILDEINDDFIAANSNFELNIPSNTRRSFMEMKKNATTNSSTAIQLYELFSDEIIVNLNDTLSRLVETSEFQHWHEIYQVQSSNNAANNL
ncbi:predicted protein [Naegleria gruberi]|uniref:Predicted protein n=1 Tax=Naegleria gruberi TaxID=5762 RepID=D2VN73_NAEGR|nr:uncharacterized protein NAEGRDRAFT_70394 [Naegleria gruberi]EFC41692.1 predicted protein [Naegleria gruberi]|eukprot:XP_002674436.1 predicted protein [Naegleria gruberi strain NEG-M]